ncbi:MAG: GAF domain-containing sensor histidine kinase [Ectobacillus sp.]
MTEEQKRMRRLQALKEIAERLNEATHLEIMLKNALQQLLQVMNLETGWVFFIDKEGKHELAANISLPPGLARKEKKPMCEGACWCIDRFVDGRLQKATNIIECKRIEDAIAYNWGDTRGITHHATIPLRAGDEKFGLLNVASPGKTRFTEEELALLEAIAYQIGTTIKRIKLVERERQYIVAAERNRLARDLHDSVKQLLFSIMLTARGVQDMTNDEELQSMLAYIGDLSQQAMQEMRTLIWQLRPEGLERGIIEALKSYGEMLGLTVHPDLSCVLCLNHAIEETFWRIGQEALNNCKKHAGCTDVYIRFSIHKEENTVTIKVLDHGVGFDIMAAKSISSGLKNMRERAELAGGALQIESKEGEGTAIIVTLPL